MGYYTTFWIKWKFVKEPEYCPLCNQTATYLHNEELLEVLIKIVGYEGFTDTIYEGYMYVLDESKWYKWKENLVEFTKKIPDMLVEIYAEGEENEDIWKARFLNGKMERQDAKIMVPEFKEIKGE